MLREFLKSKSLDCSDKALKQYEGFADLTLEWNERINVTAIRDKEEFITKNVIDSLCLAGSPYLTGASRILDLGTGGGLPGMPLAIAYPEKSFILTDAIGKKLKVIDDVAAKLGIYNVTTVHGRAEDLARDKQFRESFDLCVSRAVANMSVLSEYCLPFVRKGGAFVAYKTESSVEELEAASSAIKKLGGGNSSLFDAGLEGTGHIFISIEKLAATPAAYPRKAGIPVKQPL